MLLYHCDFCKEVWNWELGGHLGVNDHSVICLECKKKQEAEKSEEPAVHEGETVQPEEPPSTEEVVKDPEPEEKTAE